MAKPEDMESLSDEERETIWEEGHRAFDMDEPEHGNPYRPGTIEHEIWSDGWEDGYEDDQQASQKR